MYITVRFSFGAYKIFPTNFDLQPAHSPISSMVEHWYTVWSMHEDALQTIFIHDIIGWVRVEDYINPSLPPPLPPAHIHTYTKIKLNQNTTTKIPKID